MMKRLVARLSQLTDQNILCHSLDPEARLDHRERLDPKDIKDPVESRESQALRVYQEQGDYLDHKVYPAKMVIMAEMEKMEQRALPVLREIQVHQEFLGWQARKVTGVLGAHLVRRVILDDLEKGVTTVRQVLWAHLAVRVLEVRRENEGLKARMVLWANVDRMVNLDQLVLLESLVLLDLLDFLDSLELRGILEHQVIKEPSACLVPMDSTVCPAHPESQAVWGPLAVMVRPEAAEKGVNLVRQGILDFQGLLGL
jgi:hypothetical protein